MHNKYLSLFVSCGLLSYSALAQDELALQSPLLPPLEEVFVTGGKDNIRTLSGSAQLLDEQALQLFDYTDLNQVLTQLPGVYIRQEDGYGLRPNIGIRGATSERSQKITIMEDGVLITPAPYSAPAAYYIPNVSRMAAVEVLKGPAAIKHGPHTVGGAINFVTQAIPEAQQTFIDATLGSDNFQKWRLFHGDNGERFGYWVDALRYSSDGFKDLDNGDDTGFVRNDINAKLQWRSAANAQMPQILTIKLGFADEESDETYLGLSDADFRANPNRRYSASQLDRFESEHTQLHVDHVIQLNEKLKLNSKVYWNEFDRVWNRFNGFLAGPGAEAVLANPDIFTQEIALLRGEVDSNNSLAQRLGLTSNDRQFGSQGIQVNATLNLDGEQIKHELTAGFRFHHDYVERDHQTTGYFMQNANLVLDNLPRIPTTLNKGETDALALYIHDIISWQNWEFTAGIRFEEIEGTLDDNLNDIQSDNDQSIAIPGLGAFWQFNESLGFLFGINRGFSPAGPGAGDNVDPEESLNYEYGLRYQQEKLSIEAIGFFSDYDNLLGRCRASDVGCNVGEEFNGGAVEISGIEINGQYEFTLSEQLSLPISLSLTQTDSAFQTSFTSNFSQWGIVEQGDELPYIPELSARVQIGLNAAQWQLQMAWKHTDQMREQAGSGRISDGPHTDQLNSIDLSASWQASAALLLQVTVDNATDTESIVSHRPFGARPNKPRSFNIRAKYSF